MLIQSPWVKACLCLCFTWNRVDWQLPGVKNSQMKKLWTPEKRPNTVLLNIHHAIRITAAEMVTVNKTSSSVIMSDNLQKIHSLELNQRSSRELWFQSGNHKMKVLLQPPLVLKSLPCSALGFWRVVSIHILTSKIITGTAGGFF